jgi:hypothetical protein
MHMLEFKYPGYDFQSQGLTNKLAASYYFVLQCNYPVNVYVCPLTMKSYFYNWIWKENKYLWFGKEKVSGSEIHTSNLTKILHKSIVPVKFRTVITSARNNFQNAFFTSKW